MLNLQTAMDQVGSSGKYQLRIFLLFCVVIFVLTCQIMGATYNYIKPIFLCDGQICQENQESCQGNISIDPNFKYKNLITDFHLFCERDYLISIGGSINFLGSVFGGVVMSFLADLKGRKFTFLVCWSCCTISFIGIFLSINFEMYLIMTFLMGFFEVGAYILIPVILNEICSTKLRQIYTLAILIVWSLTEILLAIAFYFIENWRVIQLWFIVFPSIIVLIFSVFVLETPKFYFSKKEYKLALNVLNKIATINKKPLIQNVEFYENDYDKSRRSKRYTFFDLFKFQSLRLPSVGFFCISFTLHLIYYGGQYGMKDISRGNMIYIMGITVGFSECITYSSITFFIHKIKRRITLMCSFILSIIGCLIFITYGIHSYELSCSDCVQESLTIILLCLIRIFNTFGFGIQGLFSNEFYPTSIRAIGSGFLFSAGLLGSFTSPYIAVLGKLLNFNPFLLIAVISFIGSFGTLLTRETKGKPLKDQINELIQTEEQQLVS